MKGLYRLFRSFRYAVRGLSLVLQEEHNIRIQLLFGFLAAALAFSLGISRLEWVALISASASVVLAEVINSAVERVCDLLKPRLDAHVKEIKDIMAGAVLLASLAAVAVGLIIFLPPLYAILFTP